MPLVDYLIQPGEMMTPEAADRKRKIAQALLMRGSDTSPVQHWSQGAARLSDALFGALEDVKVDRQESNAKKDASGLESGLFAALGGGGGASAPAASSGVAGALGDDYFATMAKKESAGNPNARNKSGATGLYQFMPGTWRGLMEKNPGLGLTYDGMTDPQQQQVAMQQFTKENAAVLAKAGLPVNNATLALAHQQGAGGAIKLLSNADAPAASVVGKAAVVQNGGDLNMTAGQFAQHVMGYYGFGNNNPTQVAQSGAGYQNMPATPQMAQNGAGYQNAADVAAPGAQPAEFQIPGQPQQQPQQGMGGGQSVAVQQAMRLLNNPYTSPAAKMIAQQVLARAMKGTDPLEQAQLEKLQHEKTLWGAQDKATELANQKTEAELEKMRREANMPNGELLKDANGNPIGFFDKSTMAFKPIKDLPSGVQKAPTVQKVTQPDGSEVAVQWDDKTGKWVPLEAPEGGNAVKAPGKPLTEAQSKDLGFVTRGKAANENLSKFEGALGSVAERGAAAMPGGNFLVSKEYQQAQQAGQEFLAAMLRKDSGAVIGKDELATYGGIYLPQPGDGPEVLQQKREARARAMDAIAKGLPPNAILMMEQEAQKGGNAAAQPQATTRRRYNPQTRKFEEVK